LSAVHAWLHAESRGAVLAVLPDQHFKKRSAHWNLRREKGFARIVEVVNGPSALCDVISVVTEFMVSVAATAFLMGLQRLWQNLQRQPVKRE
jgi:hypothetical protein